MINQLLRKYFPLEVTSNLRKLNHKRKRLIYYILSILPVNKKKIFITNYYKKGYGDNGKYIAEELIKRNLNYDIVWVTDSNDITAFPKQIRTVKYGSLKARYEEATSAIWIDNCRKYPYIHKRKNQIYIQTWHGGIALKKIEKDVETKLEDFYVESAKYDSKIADLFISNSKFCTELYRSAFWYDGEILESGYPRNDILVNAPENIKIKVFKYFGLDPNVKVVLYAPTFRADHNTEVYDLNYEQIRTRLEQEFGSNIVFLIRLHPNISQKVGVVSYNEYIMNATFYSDMQELMMASDILITDYSSTMFEFMIMRKPAFLYVKDLEEYKRDRDLYFNIFSLPFPIAENNETLIEHIATFNKDTYNEKLNDFRKKVGLLEDGKAAERIVDRIEAELATLHKNSKIE